MSVRLWTAGLLTTALIVLPGQPHADAKPPDLPVNEKVDCIERDDTGVWFIEFATQDSARMPTADDVVALRTLLQSALFGLHPATAFISIDDLVDLDELPFSFAQITQYVRDRLPPPDTRTESFAMDRLASFGETPLSDVPLDAQGAAEKDSDNTSTHQTLVFGGGLSWDGHITASMGYRLVGGRDPGWSLLDEVMVLSISPLDFTPGFLKCPSLQRKTDRRAADPSDEAAPCSVQDNLRKLEKARELFHQAEQLRKEGNTKGACLRYSRIHQLCPGSRFDLKARNRQKELASEQGTASEEEESAGAAPAPAPPGTTSRDLIAALRISASVEWTGYGLRAGGRISAESVSLKVVIGCDGQPHLSLTLAALAREGQPSPIELLVQRLLGLGEEKSD
jgi:hypothetical protein